MTTVKVKRKIKDRVCFHSWVENCGNILYCGMKKTVAGQTVGSGWGSEFSCKEQVTSVSLLNPPLRCLNSNVMLTKVK